jgi:hypothetical protein
MWALGTKLGSLEEQCVLLTAEPFLLALIHLCSESIHFSFLGKMKALPSREAGHMYLVAHFAEHSGRHTYLVKEKRTHSGLLTAGWKNHELPDP